MDPLSDMIGGIRAEGSSITRISVDPPYQVDFDDGAPLTMFIMIGGAGTVILADGSTSSVGTGDTALVRGPEPFRLTDRVSPMDSTAEGESTSSGAVVIAGRYRKVGARHQRVLRTLPPAVVLKEDIEDVLWLDSLRYVLTRRNRPGGQAMIDRILDWGLVCTLGCWFDQQGADAPGWYRGAMDPVTGPALEAIHQQPARAWTVGSLAAEAKVSRAHFAKRFSETMREPPLAYLAQWRMCLAEDLLSDPDQRVADVAKAVGYTDPFAFSTAFKRHRGVSPRAFRTGREQLRRSGVGAGEVG